METVRITVPLDADGFRRLRCPACGLSFKVATDAADRAEPLALAVSPVFDQDGDAVESPLPSYYCPYCRANDTSDAFLPDDQMGYFEQVAAQRASRTITDILSETLGAVNRSTRNSFLSITMSVSDPEPPPPVILGPEVSAHRRVELRCCGRPAKILPGWTETIYCLYCGKTLVLQ